MSLHASRMNANPPHQPGLMITSEVPDSPNLLVVIGVRGCKKEKKKQKKIV